MDAEAAGFARACALVAATAVGVPAYALAVAALVDAVQAPDGVAMLLLGPALLIVPWLHHRGQPRGGAGVLCALGTSVVALILAWPLTLYVLLWHTGGEL